MQNDPKLFLLMVFSFVATIFLFTMIVRKSKPERKILWIVLCTAGSIVWLGVLKGAVAAIIAILISTGYVANRLDGRRIGKKIAKSLGISPNLFFTSLEQTMPMYLAVLASAEREGMSVLEAREMTIPFLIEGLNVLETRFGQQNLIDDARKKLAEHSSVGGS
ncbi:hypothetical protein [Shewanella algae]